MIELKDRLFSAGRDGATNLSEKDMKRLERLLPV
jgi:hypothetical protein